MPPSLPRITSRTHPFVRRCRDLAAGRGPEGEVLLDGAHLVEEAVRTRLPLVGVLADARGLSVARAAATRGVPVYEGTTDVVAAASPVRTSSGVVGVATWRPESLTTVVRRPHPLLVGLVDVQDPGNVGGIIRTADALGATGVVALGSTAAPGGWKALRGAMGSTFRIPVGCGNTEDALAAARAEGLGVAAAVAGEGRPIDDAPLDAPLLILVGNEGAGLPPALLAEVDQLLTIPMRSGLNSLNVGVSAALILWEARRARESRRSPR